MLIIGSEYDMVIESTKTSGRGMYVSSAVCCPLFIPTTPFLKILSLSFNILPKIIFLKLKMLLRYLEGIIIDSNLTNILTTRGRLLDHVKPLHYFVFNAILNISLFLGDI